MAKSVNEVFLDRLLMHEIDLQQFERGSQRRVLKLLQELEEELTALIREVDPTGPKRTRYQQARLESLLEQSQKSIRTAYQKTRDLTKSNMVGITDVELGFISSTLSDVLTVQVATVEKSMEQLRRIADNTLIEGAPNKDWWAKQAGNLQHQFSAEMRKGMRVGETTGQLVRRMEKVSGISKRQAEALVRTGQQAVLQTARQDSYEANADIMDGYQTIVTFDGRTTMICISRSGLVWSADGNYTPIGHSVSFPGWPPWHWKCRTTFAPITKSWKDLKHDKRFKEIRPEQRASMDGKVPAHWDYEDWFKTKGVAFQKDVLGPGRHSMWKDGKLSFRELINQDTGKALTLDRLRAKS